MTYIYIGIGDHWVKCGKVFQDNYVPLYQNDKIDYIVDKINDATCVVCGKKISEESCLPRDY